MAAALFPPYDGPMTPAEDVRAAVTLARDAWADVPDASWDAPAGGLEWTCRETAAHVLDDLGSYAMQVSGSQGNADRAAYVPLEEWEVAPGRPRFLFWPEVSGGTAALVASLDAVGGLLEAVVAHVPDDRRGWHPYGVSDASGFAAMGVLELAVHTDDILRAQGRTFRLPDDVTRRVLRRLFPGVAPGQDPWQALLAATGRAPETAGQPWRWDSSVRQDRSR